MRTQDHYWSEQLVERDHRLYIRYMTTNYSKPERSIFYWPVGRIAPFDRETLPLPAHNNGDGIYTVRRLADLDKFDCGYDAQFTAYLTDGGKTKAEFVETEEIPTPKVRKGIETRWRNGCWEKYSKRNGWICA